MVIYNFNVRMVVDPGEWGVEGDPESAVTAFLSRELDEMERNHPGINETGVFLAGKFKTS